MRFIHTSDWQLGKPFGRLPDEARAALQEARPDAIDSLAAAAWNRGAPTVLVVGDVFDSPEPGDRVYRQALNRMKAAADALGAAAGQSRSGPHGWAVEPLPWPCPRSIPAKPPVTNALRSGRRGRISMTPRRAMRPPTHCPA